MDSAACPHAVAAAAALAEMLFNVTTTQREGTHV